jgi:hypothetical protein
MWGRASSRIAAAHRSGNLYAVLSGASAVGAGSLYVMTLREAEDRRRLEADFDAVLAAQRIKAREEVDARAERLRNAPVLWDGVVLQYDASLQGHAMLRGARAGAAVEVLEEAVGDKKKYLTARDKVTGSLGMLPMEWVRPAA